MTNPNDDQQEQESPVESVPTSGQGGLASEGGETQPDQEPPTDSDTPSE